jgi:[ribosomal protein S18]-alanine N-acetyltransferase
MNSTVSIRDYGIADLDSMFRLDEVCFAAEFRFDLRSMREFAGEQGAVVRIAQASDGEIVGFVIVHVELGEDGPVGYVVTLDVAEASRRRGLAGRLMRDAERKVMEIDGAAAMVLHVFTGNAGAIAFYERLGYERLGVRPGFYGRAGLDAFVYRKVLRDT